MVKEGNWKCCVFFVFCFFLSLLASLENGFERRVQMNKGQRRKRRTQKAAIRTEFLQCHMENCPFHQISQGTRFAVLESHVQLVACLCMPLRTLLCTLHVQYLSLCSMALLIFMISCVLCYVLCMYTPVYYAELAFCVMSLPFNLVLRRQ